MKYFPPWLQILVFGLLLFIGAEETLRITRNPNFFPTVVLLGSFVVPTAFIVYFYDHVRHRDISPSLLTTSFVVGGVLGVIVAGFLEYGTLSTLSIPALFGVGLIEESVKLIFPLMMYIGWRYRHEADGLLFGIAAGMGFAALETMGYGLVSFIQSKGDFAVLQQVLLIRGFLSRPGMPRGPASSVPCSGANERKRDEWHLTHPLWALFCWPSCSMPYGTSSTAWVSKQ